MKIDHVLLVVPNLRWCRGDESTFWHFVPYNLCLLAAMVDDLCEVEVLDAYIDDLSLDEFATIVAEKQPGVVGITVMMDQFAEAGHLAARAAKQGCPETKVVLGGVHVTVDPDEVMRDERIDYAVRGEGEYAFRQLLLFLQDEGPFPQRGVCRRNETGYVTAERAELIEDLDAVKFPAYHLIDYSRYTRHAPRKSVDSPRRLPYARIMTSRGCPYQCAFCQVEHISGRTFRRRGIENVLDEINWLKEEYGIQSLILDDDNLFSHRGHAVDLFQGMIDRGLNMPWATISTAVFRLDPELVELMRDSGCEYICIAIESGCERVLKNVINKPVDYEHARQMVAKAKSVGIYVAANFIVGFPTETWDEIRETIRFAEELGTDYVKLFHAIPLRHTRLWELCEKAGAFKSGFAVDTIRWNTGQISTDQFTPDDLTILRAYEWDRINFGLPEKRARTAAMMGVTEEELWTIRRSTLEGALKRVGQ